MQMRTIRGLSQFNTAQDRAMTAQDKDKLYGTEG